MGYQEYVGGDPWSKPEGFPVWSDDIETAIRLQRCSVLDLLLSMYEALGSIPSNTNNKNSL